MWKIFLGIAVGACLMYAVLRARSRRAAGEPKKWTARVVDWLLARDAAPEASASRRAPRTGRPRVSQDTQYQPLRAAAQAEDAGGGFRPVRMPRVRLSYQLPDGRPEVHVPVDSLPFWVGSAADCACVIPDKTVSRRHFELCAHEGSGLRICNHSRTNGIIPIRADGSEDDPILDDGVMIRLRAGVTFSFWAGDVRVTVYT